MFPIPNSSGPVWAVRLFVVGGVRSAPLCLPERGKRASDGGYATGRPPVAQMTSRPLKRSRLIAATAAATGGVNN